MAEYVEATLRLRRDQWQRIAEGEAPLAAAGAAENLLKGRPHYALIEARAPRPADGDRPPLCAVVRTRIIAGPRGGSILCIYLDCGHMVWSRAGGKRERKPVARIRCIGCWVSVAAARPERL